MQWTQGYYANEGYTYGACAELAPARLALTALLAGHTPPDLRQPFHFLDLGCGQGLNLCLLAATYPKAQFVGVDFLPEHIAHARDLAAAAELSNVQFLEGDFQTLKPAELSVEPFDMAAAHGILAWIAPELQTCLLQLASDSLRPGGLLFLSANTLPGWLDRIPLQHLASANLQQGLSGPDALEQALGLFQELEAADAALFRHLPTLAPALKALAGRAPAYVRQEYLNQHWQPRFADQLLAQAAGHKFSFLGSATLRDRFDGLLPAAQRQLINAQADPARRELVRDLVVGQAFRKDVYAKGFQPLWRERHQERIQELQLISLKPIGALADPLLYNLDLGIGQMQGAETILRPILELISEAPCTLADIAAVLARRSGEQPSTWRKQVFDQALLLLTSGLAAVVPDASVDPGPAQRLNRHLHQAIDAGAPYGVMAAPLIGNIWPWTPERRHPELINRLQIGQ